MTLFDGLGANEYEDWPLANFYATRRLSTKVVYRHRYRGTLETMNGIFRNHFPFSILVDLPVWLSLLL